MGEVNRLDDPEYAANNPEEVWDRTRMRENCPLCHRSFHIGAGGLVSHCKKKHITDLIDIAWSVIEAQGPDQCLK